MSYVLKVSQLREEAKRSKAIIKREESRLRFMAGQFNELCNQSRPLTNTYYRHASRAKRLVEFAEDLENVRRNLLL